jgi:F0F1-type ATP synthase membrane subunit b/b'
MRRPYLAAVFFLMAIPVFAQEGEPHGLDKVTLWKVANTLIFAAGLGYLIAKTAPGFFNARSAEIQKAIQDATGLKIEAEFRSSEIDRKMATLAAEVNKLREQSAAEMEREHARIRKDTSAEIEHIHRNVAAEIDAFQLGGIGQIRQHTAKLALELAERRLASQLSSNDQEEMLSDFVHLVEQGRG